MPTRGDENRQNRIYPNRADQYARQLWDLAYDARDKLANLSKLVSAIPSQIPTIDSIKKSLQSSSGSGLNLTALIGRTMTNQYAYVPKFSASPSLKDPSAVVGDGTLVTVTTNPTGASGGLLYRFNEPIDLGTFIAQQALGTTLSGTHAQRVASYPAASYEPGTLFYETDTRTLLIDEVINGVATWVNAVTPTIEDTHANRISVASVEISGGAVLRTAGNVFFPGMVGHLIAIGFDLYTVLTYIDNANITVNAAVPGVVITSSTFMLYPPTSYAQGTFFWETDRTLLYLSVGASGTVNTTGTTVDWVSGDTFSAYWAGAAITINGVGYTVDHVVGAFQLILVATAGVQAAVSSMIQGAVWKYASGTYTNTLVNIPAALGMGTYDTGALFYDTTFQHLHRWSGTAWAFAPGDGAGMLAAVNAGITPYGGVWGLCDASTYSVSIGDGTTVNIVTKNLTNGDVIRAGNSGHAAAVAPTLPGGSVTADTTAHFSGGGGVTTDDGLHGHTVATTKVTTSNGGGVLNDVAAFATYPTSDDGTHHHDVTDANCPQAAHHHALTGVTINADGMPANTGLNWYIRR